MTQPMASLQGMQAGQPMPDQESENQYTPDELEQMSALGVYDEQADPQKRALLRAQKLREGGGFKGGTYGRWGTPMPYNPWGDIAREFSANVQENRAEKKLADLTREARNALKIQERAENSPRTKSMQDLMESAESVKPGQQDFGRGSISDRIRGWFGR